LCCQQLSITTNRQLQRPLNAPTTAVQAVANSADDPVPCRTQESHYRDHGVWKAKPALAQTLFQGSRYYGGDFFNGVFMNVYPLDSRVTAKPAVLANSELLGAQDGGGYRLV